MKVVGWLAKNITSDTFVSVQVYWSNGAQILTPHDRLISESIVRESEPRDSSWDTSVLTASPLVSDPLAAVEKAYYKYNAF